MDFEILQRDAHEWCQEHMGTVPAIVTSIPDMSELDMNEADYILFLRESTNRILQCLTDKGYAIFIQTDRKSKGLIDKSYHISDEAIRICGFRMMFHKIALIRGVDVNDLYKPTYTHILCYSNKGKPGRSTPDVFNRGDVLYKNGAGKEAVLRCLEFLKKQKIETVVDPFVGQGTVILLAIQLGFKGGVGLDIDETQCVLARQNIYDMDS